MNQKPSQHKRGGFLEGKGFYIVLFLCVAAIGISGYYLFSGLLPQSSSSTQPSASVSGQAQVQEKDQNKDQSKETPTTPKDTVPSPEPAAKGNNGEASKTPDQTTAAAPAPAGYVWPVQGTVSRDFSLEVFAYDATMGDWRTHDGLDIAADLGSPVCSCAAGTVSSVEANDMIGTTITIDHGNGMESVYANLAEKVKVEQGSQVKAGQEIGAVGTTAIAESADPSHLHFALREYGVTIDPENYLP